MSELAPDLVEPIVGFRSWTLELRDPTDPDAGGWLVSDYSGDRWTPEMTARCEERLVVRDVSNHPQAPPPGPHTAPGPGCSCGLYAHHRLRILEQSAPQLTFSTSSQDALAVHRSVTIAPAIAGPDNRTFVAVAYVIGVIAAWGDVEIHRSGFRAEHARVVAVALAAPQCDESFVAGPQRAVDATARQYGAEVVALDELASAAERHGKAVPEELYPDPAPEAVELYISFRSSSGLLLPPPEHPDWEMLALYTAAMGLWVALCVAIGWRTSGLVGACVVVVWSIEGVLTLRERHKRKAEQEAAESS